MLERNRVFGGVYGLAVGDALGVPVEFMSRAMLDRDPVKGMRAGGTHKQPKGTWSDDTSMVLATLDALAAGGLSYGMIMDNFVNWLTRAKYTATGVVFDVGGTTSAAIHNYLMGDPFELCGLGDDRHCGNGSLMRMLPMIYYVYLKYGLEVSPVAVDQIYRLSGLTHANILSRVCCVYYVYIGMYLLDAGGNGDMHSAIIKAVEAVEQYYSDGVEVFYIFQKTIIQKIKVDSLIDCMNFDRGAVRSTGYVLDSLMASIWCLWHTLSYEEAVLEAVNLGDDTDTTGAITGSLAGIWYGMQSIPVEWVADLRNKRLINDICGRFYEQYK